MKSIYEYTSYLPYLVDQLGGSKQRTGKKQAAAKAMGCHTTYVSQIMKGTNELSLEQAISLGQFLNLSTEETHYFLLLVQESRAGTPKLRRYFHEQCQSIRDKRTVIQERLKDASRLPERDEARFYSTWLYGALHVLSSVPGLQTKEALAHHLKQPLPKITEALEFLQALGLIVYQNGKYVMGPAHFHLGKDSPNITKHHSNWRLQAIASLDRTSSKSDLHYSAAVTVSREDASRLRERILKFLEENVEIIRASPSEEAYVYCFDFFSLIEE